MELTDSQRILLALFNEAKIRRQEAAALLTLLDEQEINDILKQSDRIVDEQDRLPTEQELMNIIFPILKAKKTED
ncbi:MAG: hypothetical protein II129_02360 [Paludibacteraceae bacterium]|nr:hypothetical protein [Paludibacteraceae bacterium]